MSDVRRRVRQVWTSRLALWLRAYCNSSSVAAGGLMAFHTTVAVLYASGRAVSPLPFNSERVQALITSPWMPFMHVIAAGILLGGFLAPAWRTEAAVLSLGVVVSYGTALLFSAQFRNPPGSLVGAAAVLLLGGTLAVTAVARWGNDDEDT